MLTISCSFLAFHNPLGLLPFMGYRDMYSYKGCGFDQFWSEIGYFFHSGSALGIFSVVLLKCLCKWKPFLVSCGHILEVCTNFRGLKWGMDFWLRSEIGYEKSQIFGLIFKVWTAHHYPKLCRVPLPLGAESHLLQPILHVYSLGCHTSHKMSSVGC